MCSHKGLGWDEKGPSIERLARNLDDLRHIVQTLTGKGVRIEFVKEHLTFTGEDSSIAKLMLLRESIYPQVFNRPETH